MNQLFTGRRNLTFRKEGRLRVLLESSRHVSDLRLYRCYQAAYGLWDDDREDREGSISFAGTVQGA